MTKLWIILLVVLPLRLFSAGVSIGNEAVVTVPKSAYWSSIVNLRPGDGETVTNNPPQFTWFASTYSNVVNIHPQSFPIHYPVFWTNAYVLQVASNSAFTGNLQIQTTNPWNFHAVGSPLDTNATRTFYWRVIYQRGQTNYWTNGPFTFTVSVTASNLDRALLASTNRIGTNVAAHPVFAFREGEQAAIYAWAITQATYTASAGVSNLAVAATNGAYWTQITRNWNTNASANPTLGTVAETFAFDQTKGIAAVLWHWTFSGDNRWTNASMTGFLVTNLAHFTDWFGHTNNLYIAIDYHNTAGTPYMPLLLAAGYDWMFNFLGSGTDYNGQLRTNMLWRLQQQAMWASHIGVGPGGFYVDAENNGFPVFHVELNYPYTGEYMAPVGFTKLPQSHQQGYFPTVAPAFLVIADDGGRGLFAFQWYLNHMLSRSTMYAGFAAHHSGPYGYADGHVFAQTYGNGILGSMMFYDVAFPEAQLYRTEFLQGFPEWWTRMHPYQMRKSHGPWGDGSPAAEYGQAGLIGKETYGMDMARVARSGLARQTYNLYAPTTPVPVWTFTDFPLRWHYKDSLPVVTTNTTSKLYAGDGYVVASQISPSEFDCYTNGVGFTLVARPRGSTAGHVPYTDGSYDMWAYGAQITDGGGSGLSPYDYEASSAPTLLINGLGQTSPPYQDGPEVPVYASITGFTNSGTNFVYAAADVKSIFTNNIVTKLKRHILFPRSKYFVLYDEFGTTTPSTFMFRWHVPWVYRYQTSSSALANETALASDLYGSNSYARTADGFTYMGGNYTDVNAVGAGYTPPRIPVHVMFANAADQYGIFAAVGLSGLSATTSNAIGISVTNAVTNSTLNPFINHGQTYSMGVNIDRAVGLWVTNTVLSTNFHLMTVIVPKQDGVAAPTILRLDDNTVAVTYDGVTETNTFGTNYSGAFSFRVELDTVANSGGGPGGSADTLRNVRAQRATVGRIVR
jgi:hypothetical protein